MTERRIRPYKGLLVDYGGVLTTPVTRSFRAFAVELGMPSELVKEVFVEAYHAVEGDSPVHQIETGLITGDEFAVGLAAAMTERSGIDVPHERLIERLFAKVELEERMLLAVERVRAAGVATGLLSNSWGREGYPRARFPVLFDAVVISGEEGLRKPDPRIFLLAAQRLSLEPEDCVFVDDLDRNVDAAEAVGMTGLVHREPDETIPHLADLFALDPAELLA